MAAQIVSTAVLLVGTAPLRSGGFGLTVLLGVAAFCAYGGIEPIRQACSGAAVTTPVTAAVGGTGGGAPGGASGGTATASAGSGPGTPSGPGDSPAPVPPTLTLGPIVAPEAI